MSNLVGIDLNGLWDCAFISSEEARHPKFINGGVNSAAIKLSQYSKTMVVGPQTAFAPHGRGNGWGKLSDSKLRINISNALNALSEGKLTFDQNEALKNSTNFLASGARISVVAVPDSEDFNEGARDRYLRLLKSTHLSKVTLLWRTVAATLGWICQCNQSLSNQIYDGAKKVAILSILRDNVCFGDLTLEITKTHEGHLVVPVRREKGHIAIPNFGGATYSRQAAKTLAESTNLGVNDLLYGLRSLWLAAVGECPSNELFRQSDGRWHILSFPSITDSFVPSSNRNENTIARLKDAEIILIEGSAAKTHALVNSALDALGISTDDSRLCRLDSQTTARGCLEANERLHRGVPAYYDFLPQLEISALVKEKPAFTSLIPKHRRLEGGKAYHGTALGKFAVAAHAKEITFYLIKEDFDYPRISKEKLPDILDKQYPITVSIEQIPGQGYAKIFIGSDDFNSLYQRPLVLDWTNMREIRKTREEIIAKLEKGRGRTYPLAKVFKGHAVLWHPRFDFGGAKSVLTGYIDTELVINGQPSADGTEALEKLKSIATKSVIPSSNSIFRKIGIRNSDSVGARFLGTDGSIPVKKDKLPLPANACELVETAVQQAKCDYLELLRIDADPQIVRNVISFLTWCYWRCPRSVIQDLISWYEKNGPTIKSGESTVRVCGLGRSLHKSKDIKRFFSVMSNHLGRQNRPFKYIELNALARLLAGVNKAASKLDRAQADRFLQATCKVIEEEKFLDDDKAYKIRFKYALLMLAALLRHRKIRQDFLAPNESTAKNLLSLLDVVTREIKRIRENYELKAKQKERNSQKYGSKPIDRRNLSKLTAAANRLNKASEIIEELKLYVLEKGRDPNLIVRITELSDN